MSMKRLTRKSEDEYSINYGEVGEAVERLGMIEDILGTKYDLEQLRELIEGSRKESCVFIARKNILSKVQHVICMDGVGRGAVLYDDIVNAPEYHFRKD